MGKKEKQPKEKKEKVVIDGKPVKFSEKFSLNFRRKWLVNRTKLFLVIIILFSAYIALNLWATNTSLPKIDITENKIYSLSDTSKKVLANINQEVKIYVYGFSEKSTLFDLLKKYNKANNKIVYETLTEENNLEMVQKYGLQNGYGVLILKSGEAEKVIDSSELTTYDYTTYQNVDITEQTLTNSILSLTEENKPKIYFVQGHEEFGENALATLINSLKSEAFQIETINLATAGAVPDDCDILAIMSPNKDFFEVEVAPIKDYINKGGEIYFSMDSVSESLSLPNIQSILNEYGVSVQNGYIVEGDSTKAFSKNPCIFVPEVSSTNRITRDIYTDSIMWLAYSARLKFQSDEELQKLNVSKEILLNSSEKSAFITDLSSDLNTAIQNAEIGKCDIGAILTKTLPNSTEGDNTDSQTSKLAILATGSFISDYKISALNSDTPLSRLDSNKDFVINTMSFIGDKDNFITIRKDYAGTTYQATVIQLLIVIAIVILVPLFIIIFGIMVWAYRQRRK